MQPTAEQAEIIKAPVGNLLVSAAAGSGKTAVLTDRIVRRVTDGNLDIRQVLVMTFTDAAARNMKEKIADKLQSALDNAGSADMRRYLGRQLSLLPGAAISTIHAFCLDVIRNFYTCAQDAQGKPLVEPGFSIDGGVEADIMLRQTLDELMNSQYEKIDRAEEDPASRLPSGWSEAFYRLIEGYGDSSGDQAVRDLILNIYHYLRSLPDYPAFVQDRIDGLAAASLDFPASRHCGTLLKMLHLRLDRAIAVLPEMESLLSRGVRFIADSERNGAYHRQFRQVLSILAELSGLLASGSRDWNRIREMGSALSDLELPRANRSDSPEKQAFMALFYENVAEAVHFLSGSCDSDKCKRAFIFDTRPVFRLTAAEIEADLSAMLPAVRVLFELVLALDDRYTQRKRVAGMIDFSDFEHLALVILRHEEPQQYYRKRFQEIYVDEYQDTSSIQDAIIQAVSDGNCLMVGDIKQSIYRFRHARPQLFLDRASTYQKGQAGQLYELNRNFRSVAGILTAANDLFSQLMSTGAGEIEYDERQALIPHRPDFADQPTPVSLLLLNRLPGGQTAAASDSETEDFENGKTLEADEEATGDSLGREQQESLLVVRQMLALHSQGRRWQEMVVLGRTRSIVQTYRISLESCGIPVAADTGDDFLDSPTVRQMEALVHVLDNIRQDIPLAAVMRADLPQGGFTAAEMARIRLFANQHPASDDKADLRYFHQAALTYAADGPDESLRRKLADFLDWLTHLRQQEQILSISELISLIFAETGWLERLSAKSDGEAPARQLRRFRQLTEQFESRRQRGLHAFARYLENLRERGGIEMPATVQPDQDAVRIMTIHGSKGLEFPIVFLVGTGYGITPRDSKDCLLLGENLGIGPDFADPELQIRYPTHLKLAMLEEMKATGLAEELRLLYVAITRAMDRLYIAGTVKIKPGQGDSRLGRLIAQARMHTALQLPDYLVLSGKTYLEWLVLALARKKDPDLTWLLDGDLPASGQSGCVAGTSEIPVWSVELHQSSDLEKAFAGQFLPAAAAPEKSDGPEKPDPGDILAAELAKGQDRAFCDEACAAAKMLVAAPYRFEKAARTPLKVSVSELKRQEQSEAVEREEDGQLSVQGIGMVLRGLTEDEDAALPASRLGTLLHRMFRFLDLPAARMRQDLAEVARQLAAMRENGVFSEPEAAALAPFAGDILAFIRSEVADEMNRAMHEVRQPIFQEMPFTLAIPACQVYPGCSGIAADDRVLVQGIIDCWYESACGVTLIDFKSDRLSPDPSACLIELQQRYSRQLAYYAQAIQAATGKLVTRRLIWLIRQGRAYELTPTGE